MIIAIIAQNWGTSTVEPCARSLVIFCLYWSDPLMIWTHVSGQLGLSPGRKNDRMIEGMAELLDLIEAPPRIFGHSKNGIHRKFFQQSSFCQTSQRCRAALLFPKHWATRLLPTRHPAVFTWINVYVFWWAGNHFKCTHQLKGKIYIYLGVHVCMQCNAMQCSAVQCSAV